MYVDFQTKYSSVGERVKHHFIFSREQHVCLLAGERRDVSHNSSPCDPRTRNDFLGARRRSQVSLRGPAGGVTLLDRGQALMGKV